MSMVHRVPLAAKATMAPNKDGKMDAKMTEKHTKSNRAVKRVKKNVKEYSVKALTSSQIR